MLSSPVPGRVPLQTKVFTCFFETGTGFLRSVRVSGTEVIRTIYGAVRDENWDTLVSRCEVERVFQDDNRFELVFGMQCRWGAISYSWRGEIRGHGGVLEFRFDGRSDSAFRRNRIGICVLHPIAECVGRPCRTRGTDGLWRERAFPIFISPHQPFRDLRAMAWRPGDQLAAEIEFEGDVFETEDQRNWTDASFKTYSTPLDLPFPIPVAPGDEVHQHVRLTLTPDVPAASASSPVLATAGPVAVSVDPGKTIGNMPALGLALNGEDGMLTADGRARLRALQMNHLRVDLRFSRSDWQATLQDAQRVAASLGTRLQCALFLSDQAEAELAAFRDVVGDPGTVDRCLIFREGEKSTAAVWFRHAEAVLAPAGFRLATGTDVFFTEINREHPPHQAAVCYSFSPQVHTFDDLSLMETLEAQPDTVESAKQFCGGELIVSPITLAPRFNPNAITEAPPGAADTLPSTVDPRQRTLFGAAWTAGTVAQLAPLSRLTSLTFYETTGWRGVMAREDEPESVKRLFGSRDGEVYPVYHVFHALAGVRSVLGGTVSDPFRVRALAGRKDDGELVCLVANVTPEPQSVEFMGPWTQPRLAILEEANLEELRQGRSPAERPLTPTDGRLKFDLGAHAVAILTGR